MMHEMGLNRLADDFLAIEDSLIDWADTKFWDWIAPETVRTPISDQPIRLDAEIEF